MSSPRPVLLAALLGLSALPAVAAVPAGGLAVTHSGYLLDGNDRAVTNASLGIVFRIFNVRLSGETSEQLVWESRRCTVDVRGGFYTVLLGDTCNGETPLSSTHIPPGETRYLEVSIEGVTLLPRLYLATVPTAAVALTSLDTAALRADLGTAGTVNGAGSLVDWTRLKGVPAGFADGKDDDTIYTAAAGGGLTLDGTGFGLATDGSSLAKVSGGKLTVDATGAVTITGATLTNTTISGGLTGSGAALTNVDAARLGGKTLAEVQAMFLSSPAISGNVAVSGSVRVGNDTATCDSTIAGAIRWNGTSLQACNGSSWRLLDGQPAPTVTSVGPTAGPSAGGTTLTIAGTGFLPGAFVQVDGVGTALVNYVDAQTLTTVTRPSSTGGVVSVRVQNTDGKSAQLLNSFTYNVAVTGVSPATGSTGGGTTITITGAGFASGATVTVGGTAATGVTVVSPTTITATTPTGGVGAKPIVVTSPGGGTATLDNSFTYYTPVSVTFTTCGQSGYTGPSQAQCSGAYGASPAVTVLGGIQLWTVPTTGTYTISAYGAQGAYNTTPGQSLNAGSGIGLRGDFALTQGDVLKILVGQQGVTANTSYGNGNGGGGGTFVVRSDNIPLIVAGGGGGAPSVTYGLSCTRTNGDGQSGQAGKTVVCNGLGTAAGGTGGQGGQMVSGSYGGAAGGGFSSSGQAGPGSNGATPGGSGFLQGGNGGNGQNASHGYTQGGFGGGGAGDLGGPGGAGGYSGGAAAGQWSSWSEYGGGGGSYNVGSNQAVLGLQTGHGTVTIVGK